MPTFSVILKEAIVSYQTKVYRVDVDASDEQDAYGQAVELVSAHPDAYQIDTPFSEAESDGFELDHVTRVA